MKNERPVIAIVGGGASGLAAAICAARRHTADVVVLEKLDRVGKKLLATGNGRCNLENTGAAEEWYRAQDKAALRQMLGGISVRQVLGFFEKCGLVCAEAEEGRVYPACGQAAMVLDVLRLQAAAQGVREDCGFEVNGIARQKGRFCLRAADGRSLFADRVILACGGQAAPKLGGGESGYALARALGHSVTGLYPCLAPVKCRAQGMAALKGVRAVCGVQLVSGNRVVAEQRGEVQFNEGGFSGIPVLQLSCDMPKAGRDAALVLDLLPWVEAPALETMLHSRRKGGAYATLDTLLLGLMHKKLGQYIIKISGLGAPGRPVNELRPQEISMLTGLIKGWRVPVSATDDWNEAQVTGGGVPLGEMEPGSFASRRCEGLYITGELLDAVGGCGGFNLHWAFGSGICAGNAAAESLAANAKG